MRSTLWTLAALLMLVAPLHAADCNVNTIEDTCDIDCGVAAGPCDVPGCGMSADCDANGIPDECDIGSAPTGCTFPVTLLENTTSVADSVFLVPWLFETVTRPGTVLRQARGWFSRGGTWEAFFDEAWETPPTRVPARILPHDALRIVVREDDVVDGIIYDEGPRNLELALGGLLTQWGGPRGEVFQLLDASLYLSEQRVAGVALDMARGSASETPRGGDWAFLISGDSLHVLLEGNEEHDGDVAPEYRGWARFGIEEFRWPSLTVAWAETSAFQPARRDVPVAWTFTSASGEVTGTLSVRSAEVEAGDGPGPVLPVHALFEVEGVIDIADRSFPVHGLFRHERRR